MAAIVLAAGLPGAGEPLAGVAAVAVALAVERSAPVVLVEVGRPRGRGPTMLAAETARRLEARLRDAGVRCAARGRIAWVGIAEEGWTEAAREVAALAAEAEAVLVVVEPRLVAEGLADPGLAIDGALLCAELPAQRPLAALAVGELLTAGVRVRVLSRAPGRVAARRALAGIDPGGESARRSARLARGLLGVGPASPPRNRHRLRSRLATESGQALPLVLGGVVALACASLALAALGGAVTGKSRTQRAADLAALSAAREMRDDFGRLFVPARRPDGRPDPGHLSKGEYLRRATEAAQEAARRNGVGQGRLQVEFPDRSSFAPLRVRAELGAELDTPGDLPKLPVAVHAEAEAVPATPAAGATSGPAYATGGGYSGPLEYRQGEGMRPDVAAAFDRMAAAAAADRISLLVNDGFRSDAEQAILWAQNPDPRWVAPPGTSLHRCATELDLGPASAYGWLAANAPRFGFLLRYSWEPWHWGYIEGPEPCSTAGDQVGTGDGEAGAADGDSGEVSLPSFVPGEFRAAIAAAAQRWNVSGALLAAQLMAESNFNPFAVSPAGAAGIAQFMPATAASYGLDDPFDAAAAIDAQAHLMADLLERFGDPSLALAAYNAGPGAVEPCGCVPSIPETQAYVARILGLIHGAGATLVAAGAPALEVRLVD